MMENKSDYRSVFVQLERIKELVEICERTNVAFDFTKVAHHLGIVGVELYETSYKLGKAGCNNG